MMSEQTMNILRRAGWEESRRISVDGWRAVLEEEGFGLNDAAEQFLAEFGGISVPDGGPGQTMYRASFAFDPTLCLGEEDRFAEWSEVLGSVISPIGELEEGRFFLGMDSRGTIYVIADRLGRLGAQESALDALALGRAPEWLP